MSPLQAQGVSHIQPREYSAPKPITAPPNISDVATKQTMMMGDTFSKLGSSVMRIGEQIQDQIDDAATANNISGLTERMSTLASDYNNKEGENAVNGLEQFNTDVSNAIKEYGGNTINDNQKRLYGMKADVLARTARMNAYSHFDVQRGKMEEIGLTTDITSMVRMASLATDDGDRGSYLSAAQEKVSLLAKKKGIPQFNENGEETSAFRELFIDKVADPMAVSMVSRMLTDGNYQQALSYLDTNKTTISQDKYDRLNEAVVTARNSKGGIEIGDAVYDGKEIPAPGPTPRTPSGQLPANIKFKDNRVAAGYGQLAPEMQGTLEIVAAQYKAATGNDLRIVDTFRTREQQQKLYDELPPKGAPVAPPGKSRHEIGMAVDIDGEQSKVLERLGILKDNGLENLARIGDGGHIQFLKRPPVVASGGSGETYEQKADRIKGMNLPQEQERAALAQLHHREAEKEAIKSQTKKDDWDLASSMIQTGKMTAQQFAAQHPDVWSRIKAQEPAQAAVLQEGALHGDDTDTLVSLLRDPKLQNPGSVETFWRDGKISRGTYLKYVSAFSDGGKLSDEKIRNVQSYNEQFNAELVRSGFGDYVNGEKLSKTKKEQLIELKAEFDAAVTEQQRGQKKQLDWTEQQGVLQRILRNKVAVDGWGGSVKPVFQMNQTEFGKAYVMYGDQKVFLSSIPATDRTQIIAALASRGNYSPAETDIVSYYMRNKNRKK